MRAPDQVQFLLDLYDQFVVRNPAFPARRDVTFLIRDTLAKGQKVLLEGPQSYWLSNASEKFWESSTSADTSAHGLLATGRYGRAVACRVQRGRKGWKQAEGEAALPPIREMRPHKFCDCIQPQNSPDSTTLTLHLNII